MSTLKVNNLQVGQDGTAANNYTLYQPAVPDGTVRLGYGVSGSVTDILTLKNSSLGIGTDNPSAKLHVVGGGKLEGNYEITNRFEFQSGDGFLSYGLFSAYDDMEVYGNYYTKLGKVSGAPNTTWKDAIIIENSQNLTQDLITLNANTFIDGNIGIGTNNPGDRLTVYKANVGNPTGITIRNTEASSTYSHARLRLESQNAAAYADIWADVANSALRLGYNSSSTVNINSSGRITAPERIYVGETYNISNVSGSIGGSGGGQDYIGLRHGTTFGLMLKTAGTNVGNVGIGETEPDRRLHVKSGVNNNDGALRIESSTNNIMDMGTDGTGHFLNCVNNDPFRIKFAGTERIRVSETNGLTGQYVDRWFEFGIQYYNNGSSTWSSNGLFFLHANTPPINETGDQIRCSFPTAYAHKDFIKVRLWVGHAGNNSGQTWTGAVTVYHAAYYEGYTQGGSTTFNITVGTISNGKVSWVDFESSMPSTVSGNEWISMRIDWTEDAGATTLGTFGLQVVESTNPF